MPQYVARYASPLGTRHDLAVHLAVAPRRVAADDRSEVSDPGQLLGVGVVARRGTTHRPRPGGCPSPTGTVRRRARGLGPSATRASPGPSGRGYRSTVTTGSACDSSGGVPTPHSRSVRTRLGSAAPTTRLGHQARRCTRRAPRPSPPQRRRSGVGPSSPRLGPLIQQPVVAGPVPALDQRCGQGKVGQPPVTDPAFAPGDLFGHAP